ncbi:DNA repair exonuclease [Halorhabdus amylolytica]|uniref:DNA repair exonuclease n=1 Tax=Halorhabdus amylolytica TaxID=2559573 RepID=UPI0010A9CC25|nr:DNA repair exonuclease [Halorhabdus amylolytica]
MTKLLHLSDTHLGNRQYGSDTRRDDFTRAFEGAIDRALEEDVDAVIHTGDLFHRRTPSLPIVTDCIEILRKLADADIPFYGIVGNHDRKMDQQWLDLIRETGTAERLDQTPTMVNGDVALYGIDAVTSPAWHAADFTLEDSPNPDAFRLLGMHQLFEPLVPEFYADHDLADVLDRVNIDIDAIALGDYHKTESSIVEGVPAWYAGSTERCATDEIEPRTVSLLEIEDGDLERRELELDTREFESIRIEFDEGDSHGYARDELDRHQLDDKVAIVTLTGERTPVTSSDVYDMAVDKGAAVCKVDDDRGRRQLDLDGGPQGDIQSADKLIEEKLADQHLSEIATEVEERVRTDDNLAQTAIDDTMEELIREAQADAFDERDTELELGETAEEVNGE